MTKSHRQLQADLEARALSFASHDLYRVLLERDLHEGKRRGDWGVVAAAYDDLAKIAEFEAWVESATLDKEPDTARVRRALARECQIANLRLLNAGNTAVTDQGRAPIECRSNGVHAISIANELKVVDCLRYCDLGLCRCRYAPIPASSPGPR